MNLYPSLYELTFLAREAGKVMRKHFDQGRTWSLKEDSTPVTKADLEINALVLRYFEHNFPHVHVHAEEGDREVEDAEYVVLCDPLDGTSPYSLAIPVSAFALTVLKQGEPIAAVIHEPFMSRTWTAKQGEGATLNTATKVRVSTHDTLKDSNVMLVKWPGCGFSLDWVENQLALSGAKVQNITSLAYFGGLIASGYVEASIFPGRGLLETAAMQLIVEEAGGRVTDLSGAKIVYSRAANYRHKGGSLVSNGVLHDSLLMYTDPAPILE